MIKEYCKRYDFIFEFRAQRDGYRKRLSLIPGTYYKSLILETPLLL